MSLRRTIAAARTGGAGTRTSMRRLSRDLMTRSPRTGAKTPRAQIATMSRSARTVGAPKSACSHSIVVNGVRPVDRGQPSATCHWSFPSRGRGESCACAEVNGAGGSFNRLVDSARHFVDRLHQLAWHQRRECRIIMQSTREADVTFRANTIAISQASVDQFGHESCRARQCA